MRTVGARISESPEERGVESFSRPFRVPIRVTLVGDGVPIVSRSGDHRLEIRYTDSPSCGFDASNR